MLLLRGVQLPLQRVGLACALQHGFQIANRRRAAAVSKRARADKFECRGAKAVVGHDDRRHVAGNQSLGAADALLQCIAIGVQIEDHHIAFTGRNQPVHSISVRFQQELRNLCREPKKGGGEGYGLPSKVRW